MYARDLVFFSVFAVFCGIGSALIAYVIGYAAAVAGSAAFLLALIYAVRAVLVLRASDPAHASPLPPSLDANSVEEFLRERDNLDAPLQPESASCIHWVGKRGVRTELVVLFLHGFSASPPEISPVDDQIANALGANLLRFRFAGHGMKPVERGGQALLHRATPTNLLKDAAVAFACARMIGKRVIILGSSTGGTLATWLACHPGFAPHHDVAALILFSPAYGLCKPSANIYAVFKWLMVLLPHSVASEIVAALVGRHRQLPLVSERQACAWTHSYPSAATLSPIQLYVRMDVSVRMRNLIPPVLVFANPRDPVADFNVTCQRIAEARDAQLERVTSSENAHVITGDILSPSTVGATVTRALLFLREKLGSDAVVTPLRHTRRTSPARSPGLTAAWPR